MEEEESQLQTNCSRQPSIFLNSGSLVIFSVVVFVVLGMMFRSDQQVKKNWDFLNLVLVVFAFLCGFLGRNAGENHGGQFEDYHDSSVRSESVYRSNSLPEHQWHKSYDRADYNAMSNSLRSCSSYPDLRREHPMIAGDEIWRFSDDTRLLNNGNNIEAEVRAKRPDKVSFTKELSNSARRKKKAERGSKSFESFHTLISSDNKHETQPIAPLFYKKDSSSRKGRTKKIKPTPYSLSPTPGTETCAYNIPAKKYLPPNETTSFRNGDDDDGMGSDSTLFAIPAPPPLPPFGMPQRDFISIKSHCNSPRGLSPVVDECQGWPSQRTDGEVAAIADVNTEAERFIARFRAGLMLERMNSV